MTATYTARVLAVDDDGPTVRVPLLGANQRWGPLTSSITDLDVGDSVIVTPLGEASDRLHVVARLQGRPVAQSEIPGLTDRLSAIEQKNTGQDSRIDGLQAATGSALDALAARSTSLETRAGNVEQKNTAQDSRLSTIEQKNTDQDTSIAANASAISTNGTRITNLDNTTLHRTGAETKAGVLTLSDEPVVPPAVLTTSPVRSDDRRVMRRMCKIEMAGSSQVSLTAGQDVYAYTGWQVAPNGGDRYAMSTLSTVAGTLSYITIPFTDWWEFDLKAIFISSSNTANFCAAFVTLGAAAAANSIARKVGKYVPATNDGTPVQARDVWYCTAGQRVYWGVYSDVNSGLLPVAGVSSNVRTRLIVSHHAAA